MKIKDVDFSQYEYQRIQIKDHHSTKYFPGNAEDILLRLHGEEELAEEDPVSINETGWLCLLLAEKKAENEA